MLSELAEISTAYRGLGRGLV